MVDRYFFGEVKRISPEAPVPVFLKKKVKFVAGGAANVMMNLVAAGQRVIASSVIGNDEYADKLIDILLQGGCSCEGIIRSQERCTSVKTRLLAQNNQQLLRIDEEITRPICPEEEACIVDFTTRVIQDIDIIILSDYMKGVLTEAVCSGIIEVAEKHSVPVLIDIKDPNPAKYCGATVLKPNRGELALVTGMPVETDAQLLAAAKILQEQCAVQFVLVTLSSKGMLLVGNALEKWIPCCAQEVYDVSGAGDTVISFLAASMANQFDISEAAEIANLAAGVKVTKLGTSPVSLDEVFKDHEGTNTVETIYMKTSKVVTTDALLERLKGKKETVVFTNGCFDILHFGHVGYLRKAASLGDILVVGLNSDASVKRLKGNGRPINCETDRAEILSALEFVDYVVLFDEDTPYELISSIKPNILVKGADYTKENVVGADIVEQAGGQVVLIPFLEGRSTSSILRKQHESELMTE